VNGHGGVSGAKKTPSGYHKSTFIHLFFFLSLSHCLESHSNSIYLSFFLFFLSFSNQALGA
jgi:hypothetical protein